MLLGEEVPATTASEEYVAALKGEFHATLARALDKTSAEKAEVAELKEAVRWLEAAARCWEVEKAELQQELAIAAAASQTPNSTLVQLLCREALQRARGGRLCSARGLRAAS
ncbi:unnamed protein product [Symbiodinium natans]|uniref:Uncharacterized protein n=1 Tax=Symbiodinium natans TaxID=878477 RepID=A0A812UWG7_9DINO|nr:unnamed protein product [Symbiodinium natans]